MNIVRKAEDGRYVVGHYNSKGEWEPLSFGKGFEDAARLANYLNGGTGEPLFSGAAPAQEGAPNEPA